MSNAYRAVVSAGGGTAPTGDAVVADVLSGKTFSNANSVGLTGTMTNNGGVSQSLTPGQSYTVPEGYHDGTGTVTAAPTKIMDAKILEVITLTAGEGARQITFTDDEIEDNHSYLIGVCATSVSPTVGDTVADLIADTVSVNMPCAVQFDNGVGTIWYQSTIAHVYTGSFTLSNHTISGNWAGSSSAHKLVLFKID